MILRSLNNTQVSKVTLNKNVPLNGRLEIVKSLGLNKWLVSFLGNCFEVKSSLPLKVGFTYFAKMISTSGNFLIHVNYASLFRDLDLFESNNKVILKLRGEPLEQNTWKLFKNVFDNIKDEFILKFLLALHEQGIREQDFMQIYDYFGSKVREREQYNKLPVFIESNNNFIIAIPFRFMEGNGLLFLFSYKDLEMVYKWSFVYFLNEQEKIICEINNSGSNFKLRIYADFSLSKIIRELKSSLFCYNVTDIEILDSIQEFEDFDCEVIVVKGINYKI
ncbi:hypothetical protein [Borrelia hermsii]|uniref:Uncharacterized protein n=3 Tax=Borrelia hermsii TaxID=140 RepID=A0AAN0X4W1_BORHE|nr:hypothetical protein [Borrelia hermsii]AAX17198.1 hypothetical protein BH0699A [Borrelia hermsii DAH]AJW73481.1 hypothetical protein L283_03510 [Borrelia hermsii CC1]AMR75166.1 hypothetical protein A0V01_00800 [Borrelia hermsii]ANA43497.1 hypothetical protein AXX13_03520 [Borrelia hermsii HS1]UCP01696.1 hypothetical protein K9R62_03560 [Borrelia hermsii]